MLPQNLFVFRKNVFSIRLSYHKALILYDFPSSTIKATYNLKYVPQNVRIDSLSKFVYHHHESFLALLV
jgi:hypothetical protein